MWNNRGLDPNRASVPAAAKDSSRLTQSRQTGTCSLGASAGVRLPTLACVHAQGCPAVWEGRSWGHARMDESPRPCAKQRELCAACCDPRERTAGKRQNQEQPDGAGGDEGGAQSEGKGLQGSLGVNG